MGKNNSCENEDKFLINKIKQKNKKIQKDIKEYNLLDHDNDVDEIVQKMEKEGKVEIDLIKIAVKKRR